MQLARREQPWDIREEYVFRYFQMWLRANADPRPEPDGSFYLGDVEDAAPKNWRRLTPYSPAEKEEERRTTK